MTFFEIKLSSLRRVLGSQVQLEGRVAAQSHVNMLDFFNSRALQSPADVLLVGLSWPGAAEHI